MPEPHVEQPPMFIPAFLPSPPLPVRAPRARRAICAVAQPPEPRVPSPDGRSQFDRVYLEKVRAKLVNARRAASAARSEALVSAGDEDEDPETVLTAALPDDLDAIDDILYDRGPLNDKQVRLFGAWLDDRVAGRKAGSARAASNSGAQRDDNGQFDVTSHHKITLTPAQAEDRAAAVFSAAMAAFNKGQYAEAVQLYAEAVELVGAPGRLGGQYQLWHAQALDALGEKKQAAKMLDGLRNHGDADVRKVSRELLFIMTAPALELEPGSFLDIPSFDEEPRSSKGLPLLSSNFGPLRTALVEKEPEPHTLEWYMKKERPPKVEDNSGVQVVLLAAAICFTLVFMLATHPA